MDLSARINAIRDNAVRAKALLQQERIVVCLRQRASVCFFVAGPLGDEQVVGACTSADEALTCLSERQATVLLCNDQLEIGCGVELVVTAKQRWPALRTLLLISGQPSPQHLRPAISAGCDGLLLDASLGQGSAISALHTICGGGIVIDRSVRELLHAPLGAQSGAAFAPLSPREREVLTLLARGDNNSEIAQALVISLDTVKTHVRNLLLKLGAKGRTHAAVLAIEHGLVAWPQAACAR